MLRCEAPPLARRDEHQDEHDEEDEIMWEVYWLDIKALPLARRFAEERVDVMRTRFELFSLVATTVRDFTILLHLFMADAALFKDKYDEYKEIRGDLQSLMDYHDQQRRDRLQEEEDEEMALAWENDMLWGELRPRSRSRSPRAYLLGDRRDYMQWSSPNPDSD